MTGDFEDREDEGGASAPLDSGGRRFHRSSPLPTRIRDGSFEEEHLNAAGAQVPWTSIRYVALAVIQQMVKDRELKAGPLRNMVNKVMSGGGKEKDSDKDRARQNRDIYLLDVFVEGQDQPYRFEGTNINYKAFLDRSGYVSHHNFYRFCVQLARRLPPDVLCNQSFPEFLAKQRGRLSRYDDYHDFELEFSQQVRMKRDLVTIEGVDLSSDSWVEEWNDDD